ncbi:MAG: peptide chain release factor 1 [Cyanobacteria bacterium P01_H01_bin.58]
MRNPLWRLKTLPWIALLQNALLTVTLATLLEFALLFILTLTSGAQGATVAIPGGSTGFLLLSLAVSGGVGALAVLLMQRLFRNVILDSAVLWGLVGCLVLVLFIKSLLVPTVLVGISRPQLIGLVFGLFAQGRSHWR